VQKLSLVGGIKTGRNPKKSLIEWHSGMLPKGTNMIKIYSLQNYLKTCLDPYVARSTCSDTVEVEELIDIMASGRTTLSKPDITGCLQLFLEEVIEKTADGKHVKTPFGSFYLSANGRFEEKNQPFTPGIGNLGHAFTLHFRTNKTVEAKIISQARWERIENFDKSTASIDQISVIGREPGENAHAGDTIKITGRRLKFDTADTSCGVFLNSDTTSWRAAVYADIAPSKVIAALPADIPAGTYELTIITMPNGKDLKSSILTEPFIIE
jgi:nucleoid DNA-binding protein